MSKKCRLVIIVLLVIMGVIGSVSIFIAKEFFTKDEIKKYTVAKVVAKCMPEKIVYKDISDEENVIEKGSDDVTVKEEKTEEERKKVTTRNKSVSEKSTSILEKGEPNKGNEETNIVNTSNKEEIVQSTYRGFATIAKIEITRTGLNTYVLSKMSTNGMEVAPCLLYSSGEINKSGNTLILGHNYKNGRIFSNNKNIQIGDKIYITSLDGVRKEYVVYNKFETTPEDTSYIRKNTSNGPEITLSTCSDDGLSRIIIEAR